MSDLTKGQKIVRSNFNPNGNSLVDRVKAICANAIDEMEKIHLEYDDSEKTDEQYAELDRCLTYFDSYLESAAMYAVKGVTA